MKFVLLTLDLVLLLQGLILIFIGKTIGILVLNKGTSGFTSNTLLIPKQDQLLFEYFDDIK